MAFRVMDRYVKKQSVSIVFFCDSIHTPKSGGHFKAFWFNLVRKCIDPYPSFERYTKQSSHVHTWDFYIEP